MADEQVARSGAGGRGAAATEVATPASSLPDINAETYPFETVQYLLDEAAFFNLFSLPDFHRRNIAISGSGEAESVIGVRINEVLHRFHVSMQPPTSEGGLRALNMIGESLGRFNSRWMFIPDSFSALPDREPPPTPLDSSRSQRFVMLDSICTFGSQDGFRGFGTGTTYPVVENGQTQLLAAAVGSILEGFGKFQGHEGTYTYCGRLSLREGFFGSLSCRVVDPNGDLRSDGSLPALEAEPESEPAITYVILRGQKKDKYQRTAYSFGTDGQVSGLDVSQQLRLFDLDAAARERGGLRSVVSIGPVIGKMTAKILFNLLNPGAPGTELAPIPFQSYNEYILTDRDGHNLGSIIADGSEGRTFNLKLAGMPGQQALRFGGFGRIVKGTGLFEGIDGLMTDNSVVGVAPHALSTLYVLRINDPDGKYKAAFNARS